MPIQPAITEEDIASWKYLFPSDDEIDLQQSPDTSCVDMASDSDNESPPARLRNPMLQNSKQDEPPPPEPDLARSLFHADTEMRQTAIQPPNTFDPATPASNLHNSCAVTQMNGPYANTNIILHSSSRSGNTSHDQIRFPDTHDHQSCPAPTHKPTEGMFGVSPTLPMTEADTETDHIDDASQSESNEIDSRAHATAQGACHNLHGVSATKEKSETWRKPPACPWRT